ncbi:MAG: type III-A CRISPR-associated protein Csm2 [Phycisphaeraceae bacterium]
MSNFGKHGQTGGGGVRRPGGGQGGGSYGGRSGGGYHDQPEDKIANHWPDYLKDGYFDADGNLRIEYVSREKVEPLIQKMANAQPKLTTGQLRRFFQHCRGLETKLKSGAATWAAIRPQFEFLDAASADAFGKTPHKIPDLFYDFISRNVHAVKTEKDFLQGFLPHFEALVGFGSLHVQKDRN